MTVNTISSIAEFDTNGVTTNFPFYFKFLANEDLVVTYVNPQGVSSILTLGTHYTVNGAGNDQGGSIVTTSALAGLGQLVVSREMDAFQLTSLRNQGKFLAETHEDVFDKLTMLIQQGFSIFNRALKRPFGRDYFFAENRRIASVADPLESQDAATKRSVELYVASILETGQGPINNAANIVYVGAGLFPRTVKSKLDDFVNVRDFEGFIISKPDISDPSTWDWTPAFQAAANYGGNIYVGDGVFTLTSVSVTKNVHWLCSQSTVFKRKAGIDIRQSYWNAGTAMFEIRTVPIRVIFSGGPTFDGNRQNQLGRYQEPSGFSVKVQPPSTVVPSLKPVELFISGAKFINGTSGYLPLRGDDAQRRYKVQVFLDKCSFYDCHFGTGKDDPQAITALGYQPDYVTAIDYVNVITNDCSFIFEQDCPQGFYSNVGIRGTYAGSSYTTSGGASVIMFGTTYSKNMGRQGRKWNDWNDYTYNNGIGVFDMYGNADELFIEFLEGETNQNVTMRAKGSVKRFTLLSGRFRNCPRPVQVSPSTTGPCEAIVYVGPMDCQGGTIPQLELVGTSTTDRLPSVTVIGVNTKGANTNPESLSLNGAVRFRNIINLKGSSIQVEDCADQGITIIDCVRSDLDGLTVKTASAQGIYLGGATTQLLNISGFDVRGCGLDGVSIASGTTGDVNVSKGYISGAVGNGVLGNSSACKLIVDAVHVDSITGSSRGFYSGGGDPIFTNNRSTNTTNPIGLAPGVRSEQRSNSWNPIKTFGAAAPTAGTWTRGDIVEGTAPSGGGTQGWICVTSGAPGTWKAYGDISA